MAQDSGNSHRDTRLLRHGEGVQLPENDSVQFGSDTVDPQGVGIVLPSSGASVIFDSTADEFSGGQYLGGQDQLPSYLIAQSFTAPSGGMLTDVKLGLYNLGNTGYVTVELFADNNTSPGVDLGTIGTLTASQLSGGTQNYDVTTTPMALVGGSRYWIELIEHDNNYIFWNSSTVFGGIEDASEYTDRGGVVTTDSSNGVFFMQVSETATCFAAGTRILTARGEVAVEALREGDQVMALRQGGFAPVKWVGRRHVEPGRHRSPDAFNPVRIREGAFAPSLPHRDLLVSPDHALFVDGHFVSARQLINGATIAQESVARIVYYHVELDSHEVLMAEGMGAESFLDVGNRAAFENGGAPIQAHPEFARDTWDALACAPSMQEEGLAEVRGRLLERAWALGHITTDDPDLHLLAGNNTIRPAMSGNIAEFALPPGTDRVLIISRCATPKHTGAASADGRRLGVGVCRITLDDADVALNDPGLAQGWHNAEQALRWTDGSGLLETGGARVLRLRLHRGLRYWERPGQALRRAA